MLAISNSARRFKGFKVEETFKIYSSRRRGSEHEIFLE